MEAVDRRARKIYFPLKPYLLVYIRPFFPDIMDYFLKKNAKLWIRNLFVYTIRLITDYFLYILFKKNLI